MVSVFLLFRPITTGLVGGRLYDLVAKTVEVRPASGRGGSAVCSGALSAAIFRLDFGKRVNLLSKHLIPLSRAKLSSFTAQDTHSEDLDEKNDVCFVEESYQLQK